MRRQLNAGLSGLAALWIFGIMLLICFDVGMRTFLNRPISGVAEFVAMSVVGVVFLVLPSLIAERRLLRAEMFIEPLEAHNPGAAALLNLVYSLIGVYLCWKIAAWAIPMMEKAWTEGDFAGVQGAYMIPIWPFKLTLVVGALIGLLQFIWAAAEQVRGIVKVVTAVADGNLRQKLTVQAKGEVAALAAGLPARSRGGGVLSR